MRVPMFLGAAALAVGLGWWVFVVTLLPEQQRDGASSFGQFALAAVSLVLTLTRTVHAGRRGRAAASPDDIADRLATFTRQQWIEAAAERELLEPAPLAIRWTRCGGPVASPVAAATAVRTRVGVAPVPGVERTQPEQLCEGYSDELYRIYAGLPSGRLIVAGGPGAGKSSAAILLLLDALRHREHAGPAQRHRIPVPVLFTLHGWDPAKLPVRDWLVDSVARLHPLAPGRRGRAQAAVLLDTGRISVILDGLDEIPALHRPGALRALAREARCRLILLTRTSELVETTARQILTGAVALELQSPSTSEAASYLRESLPDPPPHEWRRLLDALSSTANTPLHAALGTPLTITLLRDTYDTSTDLPREAPDELLDTARFPTPRDVLHHLLDRAIDAAYTVRPGLPRPPCTPTTARRTLAFVARQLHSRGTRDLAWWDVPTWTPRSVHVLVNTAFAAVLLGPAVGVAGGLVFGVTVGLATGLRTARGPAYDGGSLPAATGIGNGVTLGLLGGASGGFVGGSAVCLVGSAIGGLTVGLLAGLAASTAFVVALVSGPTRVPYPGHSRRGDLRYWLTFGSMGGLMGGLPVGLTHYQATSLPVTLSISTMVGLAIGLMSSASWRTAVAQVVLCVRYRIPLRLGRFLRDARRRHLLRTVGAVYQFRHATLQDRLAGGRSGSVDEGE
ncbi:hypothetical protein [Actinokineospora enzanensis]|uniref:hypothetical protein n=1 Tax=Actinokineospora enzanensis TaxID=155975 RepID=UPI00036F1028|nr:hypothetical protein [Actinokineospora enzanensis]